MLVVHHARRHVDADGAREAVRRGTGQHMPEDGSSQGPTDADSVLEVERLGEAGNVRGQLLDRRRIAHRARFAMAPKVDGDKAEGIGQLMLAGEEAAMRHQARSEEHTSELQSLMRISYAVFCLKKKTNIRRKKHTTQINRLTID